VKKTLTWLGSDAHDLWFPPLEASLDDPPGLLAAGGTLSAVRLVAAYRRGIFPWYSDGQPVLWWSPEPRAVLYPAQFQRSRSLAKSERNRGYETRLDHDFAQLIAACAAPRNYSDGTWITEEMQSAYLTLHRNGHAHSVETWHNGKLVGGLYGVQLGRVFFGESMFSIATDASKVALSRLVSECVHRGINLIDCQMNTAHLQSLGSRLLSRAEFAAHLLLHASAAVPDAWHA
jgi:leucyl/phenylalanyl-tRNA---protein transferase